MRTSFVSQQFGLFFSIVWLSTDERKLGPLGFVIEPGTPHETAKAAKVLELPKLLTVPTDSPREIGDFDLYEFMLNILKSPETPKTPVLSILSMFFLRSESAFFRVPALHRAPRTGHSNATDQPPPRAATALLRLARGCIAAVPEFRPPRNHRRRLTFVLDHPLRCSSCGRGNHTRVVTPCQMIPHPFWPQECDNAEMD